VPARPETLLSIVVPLFNEESNIASLYARLGNIEKRLSPIRLEVIFVDDCSHDATPILVKDLCEQNSNLRLIRFAKNAGSHAAIMAGLANSTGDCAMFLAGDLQDPPELIPEMLEKWSQGNSIVWAIRKVEPGRRDKLFSILYWKLAHYQTNGGLPQGGVDFFLVDRKTVEAISPSSQCNAPIFQVVAQTGFRSASVHYTKADRAGGKSGWTLQKKMSLVLETLLFSPLTLRAFTLAGMVLAAAGLLGIVATIAAYAAFASSFELIAFLASLLLVAVVFLAGLQIVVTGVVGEYVFLALKEARRAPRYVIAEKVNFDRQIRERATALR
jgi:Glycosyltransferases involved in cell wall biogenesis